MAMTSPESSLPSSLPSSSDEAAVDLAVACIAALISMRHSWGDDNDSDILAPNQFKTRTMQHHCSGEETETTEMEAIRGRKRGGRKKGGATTMTALSRDSIQYWEMLATLMWSVAVGRTNAQRTTVRHAP
jgi:hypothetical protein